MKKSRIFISIVLATLMFGTLFSAACTHSNAPAQQNAVNSAPVLDDSFDTATTPPGPTSAADTKTTPPDPTIVPEEKSTNRVLTIGSETYSGMHLFQYDVNDWYSVTVDKELVGDKKTIEFAGKKYELVYKETRTVLMALGTFYDYAIIGETDFNHVCFLPDGTLVDIYSYSSGLGSVNIGKNAKGEDVRDAVLKALKDEIDVSDLEYCDITLPTVYEDGTLSSYEIVWYNKINGIEVYDGVSVSVEADGKITSVLMSNKLGNDYSGVPDDVSIEKYVPDVEKKVREVFGDALVEFEIYNSPRPYIVCVYGEPCLRYFVGVKYIRDDGQPLREGFYVAVMLCP